MDNLNNQEEITKLTKETPKTRKRKLLTNPDGLWAKCKVCQEAGNLENMLWDKVPFKDQVGKEIFGAFEGVYFCSENCKGLL